MSLVRSIVSYAKKGLLPQYHDMYEPALLRDPYPVYETLRNRSPVYRSFDDKQWYVSRHQEMKDVFRSPQAFSTAPTYAFWSKKKRAEMAYYRRHFSKWVTNLEAPNHTQARKVLGGFLTPRFFQNCEPRIVAIIDDLLKEAGRRGSMEVVADFSRPLSTMLICEIIGLPYRDVDLFMRWEALIVDQSKPESAQQSLQEMNAYIREVVEARRRDAREDFISALIDAEGFDVDDICAQCVALFFGGYQTTQDLIASGTQTLLDHPDERQKLIRDPRLIDPCVEELLRYESPVQRRMRLVKQDVVLGGKRLKAGDNVILLLGSANRDEAVFPNPMLDITRTKNPHVAFGGGEHYCPGTVLTRLETRLALPRLFQLFPDIRLVDEQPDWCVKNSNLRRLRTLPVLLK
ncbi:MAG: cytochrome P450 [Pirellulales bacterium]